METADDILEEIEEIKEGRQDAATGPGGPPEGSAGGDLLLRSMDAGQSYDLDALAAFSGLDTVELLSTLVDFELRGLVRRLETGQFVRSQG